MKPNKQIAALILFFIVSFFSIAGVCAEFVEGKNYKVLSTSKPAQDSGNIEVLEFFWYGCPSCNNLHPHLKSWLKNAPSDVSFHYVPTVFRPNWVPGAKTYYAIKAIGAMDVLHDKVYDAIHRNKINLSKEPVLFSWVEKQGIEKKKFVDAYNSFTVQSQVAKSKQMARQYRLTGVPSLIVDGKYLTGGGMNRTPQDTIKVLEQLINKARKERATQ